MVFIEKEKWNWHNIIKVCERSHNWKLDKDFKKVFWSALTNWPAPEGYQKEKEKIRTIIKRYRPKEEEWWYPEVSEYFYPRYLSSKGGVFFTPRSYCELLSELALLYIKPEWEKEGLKIYDPACGTGALLYTFHQYKPDCEVYGQEIEHKNVLVSRWFLTHRGLDIEQQQKLVKGRPGVERIKREGRGIIKSGNTLLDDKFLKKFHIVLCNPPFNQHLEQEVHKTKDGNSAWVRQCLKHLKEKGREGITLIILPTSILVIENFYEERKRLIKYNLLEAIFYDFANKGEDTGHKFDNAQLDTCVLLLRKRKQEEQDIFFINCAGKTKNEIINEYEAERERDKKTESVESNCESEILISLNLFLLN